MRPSTTALGVLPTGPDGVVGEVDVAEAVRRSVLGGPAAARLNLSVLDVSGLDGNAAADALARSVTAIAAAEVAQVELVAHWADLHDPDTRADLSGSDLPGEVLAGLERRVRPGGDGTPRVTEFAATELGVLLGVTTTTAQGLLRDVLDLRHRHPQLWTAVRAGRARFWQARQVTWMTRGLTPVLGHAESRTRDGQGVSEMIQEWPGRTTPRSSVVRPSTCTSPRRGPRSAASLRTLASCEARCATGSRRTGQARRPPQTGR